MSFPVTINLGNFSFQLHALTELLGMFVGFRYFLFLRNKSTDIIPVNNRIVIILGALFGALFGSRLTGILEDVSQLKDQAHLWQAILQNKSIAGGLVGGLFGVELVKKWIGEKNNSGDLFVFPLLLSMIIGRIGCFSMGIHETTYGIPTNSFLGMDLGDGIHRHPVMLYELLFLGLLWIILFQIKRKGSLPNGNLFKIFLISYLIFRFVMEYLKPDIHYILGMGAIQITCLIGLIYYACLFIFSLRKTKSSQPLSHAG